MNDGGDDAPLSRRARLGFRILLAVIVAAGIVLVAISR